MSNKSKIQHQMREASARAGGSHATRRARVASIRIFVAALFSLGFPITCIEQIGVRAIAAFVALRQQARKSLRTIQNDLSFIRTILRVAGREQFARDPLISNKSLGISGASRRGTKKAPTDNEYINILHHAEDPGLKALLMLARWLGLRAQEAILSVASLKQWRKALESGRTDILVVRGTKGGRPRSVRVFNIVEGLNAIDSALFVIATGRKLAPKADLKGAVKWLSNAASRLEVQFHSLRYRYAQDAVHTLLGEGHSVPAACAMVGMYLGHGDGRGRMVKAVYCRHLIREKTSLPSNPPMFSGG